MATAVERGLALWAGVVPTAGALPSVGGAADALWSRWRALGLDVGSLAGVVLTPSCGLAASSPADARARLTRAVQAASALAERAAEAG